MGGWKEAARERGERRGSRGTTGQTACNPSTREMRRSPPTKRGGYDGCCNRRHQHLRRHRRATPPPHVPSSVSGRPNTVKIHPACVRKKYLLPKARGWTEEMEDGEGGWREGGLFYLCRKQRLVKRGHISGCVCHFQAVPLVLMSQIFALTKPDSGRISIPRCKAWSNRQIFAVEKECTRCPGTLGLVHFPAPPPLVRTRVPW